jgi:hypothetical protein
MSATITTPGAGYRRQTPTVWQALGLALWQALQHAGQRRARHELLRLAQRWAASDPALAQQLLVAARHDTTR